MFVVLKEHSRAVSVSAVMQDWEYWSVKISQFFLIFYWNQVSIVWEYQLVGGLSYVKTISDRYSQSYTNNKRICLNWFLTWPVVEHC